MYTCCRLLVYNTTTSTPDEETHCQQCRPQVSPIPAVHKHNKLQESHLTRRTASNDALQRGPSLQTKTVERRSHLIEAQCNGEVVLWPQAQLQGSNSSTSSSSKGGVRRYLIHQSSIWSSSACAHHTQMRKASQQALRCDTPPPPTHNPY
jgi:hypothetical protein